MFSSGLFIFVEDYLDYHLVEILQISQTDRNCNAADSSCCDKTKQKTIFDTIGSLTIGGRKKKKYVIGASLAFFFA